jgi:hypothetical protein
MTERDFWAQLIDKLVKETKFEILASATPDPFVSVRKINGDWVVEGDITPQIDTVINRYLDANPQAAYDFSFYGANKATPGSIAEDMKPLFQEGRFREAAELGLRDIIRTIIELELIIKSSASVVRLEDVDEEEGHSGLGIQKTGEPLFELGQIVGSRPAIAHFKRAGEDSSAYIFRHHTGDWGELDEYHKKMNEDAIDSGDRILSAYTVAGERVYIITWGNRAATIVMLAREYGKATPTGLSGQIVTDRYDLEMWGHGFGELRSEDPEAREIREQLIKEIKARGAVIASKLQKLNATIKDRIKELDARIRMAKEHGASLEEMDSIEEEAARIKEIIDRYDLEMWGHGFGELRGLGITKSGEPLERGVPHVQFYSLRDPRGRRGWPFVYAHHEAGKVVQDALEEIDIEAPPDLIASSNYERDELDDGIYKVKLYDEDAVLYLWTHGEGDFMVEPDLAENVTLVHPKSGDRKDLPASEYWAWSVDLHKEGWKPIAFTKKRLARHGLVVLPGDIPANEYAAKMYNEKPGIL